ncbi:MAG: maleylpyruvate isomerase family mycothiol-dependent enzyme [Acidimicrobiales bacterium]|nr:maleylpyruvate isomerase family mycothiol-dependent enzyme [Acidimicrobiales bacterium]
MSDPTGPDTSHLEGVDPYDALDREADALAAWAGGLADDDPAWDRPSRCEGWSVRDVLAHLVAVEEYHHACLDGRVQQFIADGFAAGHTSLDEFNQAGVDARRDQAPSLLLTQWAAADAETRRRLRERDGGDMDSSVGPYPVRHQAFHVATELATHADDMGRPVPDDEAASRLAWRAAFSRFALTEKDPSAVVEDRADGATRVATGGVDVVVDEATLVEGLVGRLPADADPDVRTALSAH